MTCDNLLENKIIIFSNRGYLDAYYRANLNIGFAIESALFQIVSTQNNIPFNNNFLTTDTNDTNSFLENTNMLQFTQNMQTATDTFISQVIDIIVQNRESRNNSNYSETLNIAFFTSFEAIQNTFFKNLANYFSLYLYFTDQVTTPSFFSVYDVIDSNLDFSSFVLSDKNHLLKTNLRNMTSSDYRKYKNVFDNFKKAFLNCSLTNETLINNSMSFVDSFGTVIDKLKSFIRFSENMVDAFDEYIVELDTYKIIIRDQESSNNINYSQSELETKLRTIISNIASTENISSSSIVEGGEDFVVGDLLTVPTPDSNEQNAIVEVTGIINGHIREVGISFSGQGFAVDDTLLDTDSNNTFNVIVNAIQNGFVTSVTENNDGSGFEVGDDSNNLTFQVEQIIPRLILSGTLTEITDYSAESSPKVRFEFTDTPTLLGSISTTQDWASLPVSTIYKQTGISGATTFSNPILNINEIVTDSNLSGRITYQTQGDTGLYGVLVHFDTKTEAADFYSVVAAASLINTSIDIDIQNNDGASSINTNKVGIDLQVTEIDAELNSIELYLSDSASNYQLSHTLTVSTGDSNDSDALLNITTINTSNLSNFSFSHDDNDSANAKYDYDSNLVFTYGNNSFEASVVEMRFSDSNDLQVANNTDSNSSLNDTFYVDVDDDADVQVKVTEIECDSNTIELEIDATNTGSYTMNQSFSPTIDSNTITTQVTSLLIDSNTIQLTSDSNFEASQIGTSFSGLTYGGDDTNEISALVTGIQIASNTIQLELIDSNDSNYSITDSDISENFGAQEITITPSQITIEADALASIIVVDTNESVELGQSYSMEYGSDSTNVISATVDEIILPADTLSFTADSDGTPSWIKRGQDIDGESSGDLSGYSVSLSSDGSIVAIGATDNDNENGTRAGHVRVYQYDSNNAWVKMGQDIDGESTYDESGVSVSLSSDGSIVAIGASQHDADDGSYNIGHVKVYQFDSNNLWVQMGQDIDGESGGDYSGYSVSLSSDGSIVAIGANANDANGKNSGHVRVYQYDSNNLWVKMGQDIDGESFLDQSGVSVSLSSDGSIVAIGATENDGNSANIDDNRGHVRVYQYDSNNLWVQMGQDIDGESAGDNSGKSVSLSSDGSIVAIGAPGHDGDKGHVRVYYANSGSTGTYSITFDGDSNVTVVVDSNGVSTSHPDLTISDTNFVDASGLFTLVTSSFSGSVNQYTITHNSITATDSNFDDDSSPFSLSSTPTGLLSGFTVTHPQFVATDSNADLSSTSFSLVETPKGIMIIDVSHDPITAINDTFESDSNNFIQLAATPTGSVVSFSQSHPLISDLASETYDADGSPFVLKDGHPHGTMTEFRLVSGESTIDVLVDKIIYDSNTGNYTLNSYTSDSNDEISEWEIQFDTKPNGIVIEVDTNIMNISLGQVSDDDSVQFESGYTMTIDAMGSIVDYSITQDGSGFDNSGTLTLSSSNGNTGAALPSITSFTVKNGKITGVSLLTGGLNYDISDTITVSKAGATSATLTVAAVRDGMISGLTINDGGANYTLDDVLTVYSSDGGNGATIVLSDIDNGHISTIQMIEDGSGFTESQTITMTHSRDATLPNQPTILISAVSTSEDESILAKMEDLNAALEG